MSNPPNGFNSNSAFNKFKGTYFNSDIDCSGGNIICRNGNFYIGNNASIYSPTNRIQFDDVGGYINFSKVYVSSNFLIYNPTSLTNVDLIPFINQTNTNITAANSNITTLQSKTTNQTFASNTTTWTGNVVFPASSIASTSISNTSFCDLSNAQTIGGVKTFSLAPNMSGAGISTASIPITSIVGTAVTLSGSQIVVGQKQFSATPLFSANIAVYGNMLLNNLALTISQATLQKIQYLSDLNNVSLQSQLNQKIDLINNNVYSGTQTYNNNIIFTGTLNNKSAVQFSYLDATSSIQFQLNNKATTFGDNSFSGANSFVDISFTGLLNNKTPLQFSYLDATSSIQQQLQNKPNLTSTNNFSGSNTFTGQFALSYNASGPIFGSPAELFATGHRSFENGGDPTLGTNVFEISLNTSTGNKRGCVWQGGESDTNTAGAKRSVFGLYFRTYSGAADPLRTPIFYSVDNETANGSLDNTLTIPSSIRMYGSLKLNGGEEISNTQLGYLTTLSENVQSAVNNLKTKLTDLVWTSGSPNKTSIVNTCETSTLTFGNTLNGISTGVFSFLSGVTSNIQDQFTSMKARTPVGSIIMHLRADLGSPFVYCDGRELNRTTAAALFAVIGTTYGAPSSTTFSVPDMRAIFLRGYGNRMIDGVAYSSTTNLSELQIDSMEAHTHSSNLSGTFLKTGTTFNVPGWTNGSNRPNESSAPASTGGVNTSFRTSNETRPINLPVYFYICSS